MAEFVLSEAEVEDNVCDDMKAIESLFMMLNMMKVQKIILHLTIFLEIMMMQLMILCLVLIFLKKLLIIVLIMTLKK